MAVLDSCRIQCPYCGEVVDLSVDSDDAGAQYIEDCSVCCRPMTVQVVVSADKSTLSVTVKRDDE